MIRGKLIITGCAAALLAQSSSTLTAGTSSEVLLPILMEASTLVEDPEARLTQLANSTLKQGRQSSLPRQKLSMPRAGSRNAYGILVTKELEAAYDAYLAGDGTKALAALDNDLARDPVHRWHNSVLRVQSLIMMGRSADALEEIELTSDLEYSVFGRRIFSEALRGEAYVWDGDYDSAVEVLAPIADQLKSWRLPTRFSAPPPNVAELFYITTAQLRTYSALAGQYLLREEIDKALSWARRAEVLYSDVHYVANHALYGRYLSVHADSYYGRALNLGFLGAAEIIAANEFAAGHRSFERASEFYSVIDYSPGTVTLQALRAWSALAIGAAQKAELEAKAAVESAINANLADLIWRIQALRGEALLAVGSASEAEHAFRSAEAAISSVSGSLSSDRAKRRFGVGKSDISYRLAQFDIANGDLNALFADLEQGRARAFVDMLASVTVASTDAASVVNEIQALDSEVRQLRLITASSGLHSNDLDRLLQQREILLDELGSKDPNLLDVFAARSITLAQAQRGLPNGSVMIYGVPMRNADNIRFLVITSTEVSLIESNFELSELKRYLTNLINGIFTEDQDLQSRASSQIRDAMALERWPDARQYLIVPSGELFFIPWSLIIDNASVSVLPTGSWILRSRRDARTSSQTVVVGDPYFGGSLPQLPGARAEAEAISKIYHTDPITGSEATMEAVREAVGLQTDILHLATHAKFDPFYPLQSAIYFSGSDGKAKALTARDLYLDPLIADFVVLSACETGVGSVEVGDDFLGLVRSFHLGGAEGVVSSLWPVDDEGTAVFMQAFHRNLSFGPGQALTMARDITREAGYEPAVYGAFVLSGAIND